MKRDFDRHYVFKCEGCKLFVWYEKHLMDMDYPDGNIPETSKCHKCDGTTNRVYNETRGGARKGAGRNPLPEDDKLVSMTIRVNKKTKVWLNKHGNASTMVRVLVESHMKKINDLKQGA